MPGTNIDRSSRGEMAAEISNAVVRLLSEYTGRGPTKTRTYIHEDVITVVLRDTLTKGERSLCRNGQTSLVLTNRKAFQNTMSDELVAAVEQLSRRHVHAFLSDNHVDPDVAVETFVLSPRAAESPALGKEAAAADESAV
jgi:uncharacterized protein YbcI